MYPRTSNFFLKNISNVIYARNVVCWIVLISYKLQLFDDLLQLKSSLQLHIDGTSPVAEDIGRQVMIRPFSGSMFVQSFYFQSFYISFLHVFLLFLCFQILTYGRRIPVAELFARIDAVDASTVKRVANRFIFDQVKPYFLHLLKDALWLQSQ